MYRSLVKPSLDKLSALLILMISSPVLLIIMVLLTLVNKGKIWFIQERPGKDGVLFRVIKFKTMTDAVNERGEHLHDEHRLTWIGSLVRKTSLDEIPQLFNVLGGTMSLVGPRPEMPYLVEKYQPWQRKRFAVPPGLTGWWQVSGRSDKPMHLHTEDDLYYVQNYSLWLDIQILFLTIWVVLRGKGAY